MSVYWCNQHLQVADADCKVHCARQFERTATKASCLFANHPVRNSGKFTKFVNIQIELVYRACPLQIENVPRANPLKIEITLGTCSRLSSATSVIWLAKDYEQEQEDGV